jgi:hypothetical protein
MPRLSYSSIYRVSASIFGLETSIDVRIDHKVFKADSLRAIYDSSISDSHDKTLDRMLLTGRLYVLMLFRCSPQLTLEMTAAVVLDVTRLALDSRQHFFLTFRTFGV